MWWSQLRVRKCVAIALVMLAAVPAIAIQIGIESYQQEAPWWWIERTGIVHLSAFTPSWERYHKGDARRLTREILQYFCVANFANNCATF